MWSFFHRLSSPKIFYGYAGKVLPGLWVMTGLLFLCGLIGGLYLAPADYQQGDAFRIIYLHVPCAALSLSIFVGMGVASVIFLVWRIKLADIAAKASAAIGAWFAFLALVTGAVWGKPMWGTWWVWDARLTSELILLFLYLGIIGLRSALPNAEVAARNCALLTIVGLVDIPIIHYSVNWWNTLHQKATLLKFAAPEIAPAMLYPLLAMMLACYCYYFGLLLLKMRQEIVLREKRSAWVQNLQVENLC